MFRVFAASVLLTGCVGGSSVETPPGPTSEFCECSTNNPAENAGSFEMCAALLPDGTGTYYEPPPYSRTSDADTQPGVPTGTVTSGTFTGSAVYPGVSWDYWVYVPVQYDGTEPAALFVLTDGGVYQGGSYATPTVLDNLIAALDCAGYPYRSGFGESIHGDNSHPDHAFGADVRWLFAEAAPL